MAPSRRGFLGISSDSALVAVLLLCGSWALVGQQPAAPRGALKMGVTRSVTVTEGTNIAAAVSPDHTRIIADLQGVLWAIPFSGGKAKPLTDPLLEPARPDWSPKGDTVTFQAYSGGTFHIWILKPDGSAVRQLTTGHGDDREPRFSPDGARIAFASDRDLKGSYDIWVVDVASGDLKQWTSSSADEFEPAWSPDGSEIAFISGTGANGTMIEAIDAAGNRRTVVTAPAGAHLNSPSWSPDGRRIAYTQFANDHSQLMVSGDRVGESNDVFPFYPSWLSNDSILYTADGKIRVTSTGGKETHDIPFQAEVVLHRPAYQRKRFDFDVRRPRQVKGIVSPALSPDGKRVVFEALNQLWLMEIGKKPEALTNDTYYKADPAWSPDGKRIAYSSDKAGTENIYVLDLAMKTEHRVTKNPASAEVSSAWSPDGTMIAFQDERGATLTVELATGTKREVIGPQFAPSKPSWSANGKTIGIGALKKYSQRFREGTSQILTVDLASGVLNYTEVAPFKSLSTRGEDGPAYSPDGSAMAFVMDSLLWVRPVDAQGIPTAPARAINREVTDAPTWSGDSKQLLYLSNGKLRMVSVDGSAPRDIPLELTWHREPTATTVIIHAGHLWDGRNADVRANVDIVVVDNRIQSVAPHNDKAHSDVLARNGRLVDASSETVIPGLWESHTHEWISGKFYGARLGRLWMAYGVTALQSQGDPVYRAVETREAYGSGGRVGPRFFASGEAIDGERIYYNFMRPTTSDAQLELELGRAQALDYDLVKTYVRLPHAMQQKAVTFAHDKMGVVTSSHYMLPGMAYGMDLMSHLSATSRFGFAYTRSAAGISYQDVRTLFQVSGMFFISTPFAMMGLYNGYPTMIEDPRLVTLNTPWNQALLLPKRDPSKRILTGLQQEEETVASVLHGGGIVATGTDSPLADVATAFHLALRAEVKYGLSPWEALQTATILPAKAFGVDQDLGTVEAGKIADLAIVDGNPLHHIEDVANVRSVMKDGRVYSVVELMAPFTLP